MIHFVLSQTDHQFLTVFHETRMTVPPAIHQGLSQQKRVIRVIFGYEDGRRIAFFS